MVYFIRAGDNGPIKIGSSHNPRERLGVLQVGNHEELKLIETVPGGVNLERKVQEDLKAFKRGHEWFNPTDEVLNYIEEIRWVDYEIIDGTPVAILWRETPDSPTDHCPFCGERHRQEEKDDHYEASCAQEWLPNNKWLSNNKWLPNNKRESRDGTILKPDNGYIIRTRHKNYRLRLF